MRFLCLIHAFSLNCADNPSIINVVSLICTDDLEMDAEILGFGWRHNENVNTSYSKVMLSTSISSIRRTMEADSSNLAGLSVVRKRQVPFLVQRMSISGCRFK